MKPVYMLTEDEVQRAQMYIEEIDKEVGSLMNRDNLPEDVKNKLITISQHLYSLSGFFRE